MERFRFSLLGLIWVVIVAAFGFAALRHASEVWASAMCSAVLCALFVAIIGMVGFRRNIRAFWTGFAFFGWGYVLLGSSEFYGRRLVTNQLLGFCWDELTRSGIFGSPQNYSAFVHGPFSEEFVAIGHLMFVSLFALAGGLLSRYFYNRREHSGQIRSGPHTRLPIR